MPGLPSALRLLACRGDHGLLGMRERTSVHRLWWSLVEVAAAGVHCSVVESGGSGKPRHPPFPVSRKTDWNPPLPGLLEPFAESSMPSLGLLQGDGFCMLN